MDHLLPKSEFITSQILYFFLTFLTCKMSFDMIYNSNILLPTKNEFDVNVKRWSKIKSDQKTTFETRI